MSRGQRMGRVESRDEWVAKISVTIFSQVNFYKMTAKLNSYKLEGGIILFIRNIHTNIT